MKAVILAGGLGTRMREETEVKPKPMVEVGSKPILWHIMKTYYHYGVKDFVICLGYKGHVIKNYFHNFALQQGDTKVSISQKERKITQLDNASEEFNVVLADTGEHAQKGARLKKVEKYIDDNDLFFVTYGDGVADVNIDELLKFHHSHGKLITLTGVRPPSRFGEIEVDGITVKKFQEKPQMGQGLINGGYMVLHRKVLSLLNTEDSCDLEMGLMESLANEGQVAVFEHKGSWECMDTIRDVQHLNKLWNQNKAFWKVWEE